MDSSSSPPSEKPPLSARDALRERIRNTPALSRLDKIFDEEDGDPEMVAMLLDSPQMIDALIEMRSVMAKYEEIVPNQDQQQQEEEDPDNPRYKMKQSHKINKKWFKTNDAAQIINQTRHSFAMEHESRKGFGSILNEIVNDLYALSLTKEMCDEIELLSLNDEAINIIAIDYEAITEQFLTEISHDVNFIENNLLNNATLDINDCILTFYLQNELFSNKNNIIYMNDSSVKYYDNKNTKLTGDRVKCGDIIHLSSDSMYTGFSDIWYVMDFDHITLRRIGIKSYGQYRHDPHVIIPGFVTQRFIDPIAAYGTFIHHHCWEDGGGTIEIELQVAKDSLIFSTDEAHKSRCSHMDDKKAKSIIATYGWKQKEWKDKHNKIKHDIKDMKNEAYYTIYIKTDAGAYGPLIAHCDHPNVSKINLASICHNRADSGYVMKYNEAQFNGKVMKRKEVDALLLRLDPAIRIREVSKCLKRGIAFGTVVIDEDKGLDTILLDSKCFVCGDGLSCTVRDALYQPDYGGDEYCEQRNHGAAKCPKADCYDSYVTAMCTGMIRFDSGKSHNHCTECDGFGQCVGDYRNQHCWQCGDHFFAGASGSFGCHNCNKNQDF